jgi:hypothetical protein
MRLSGKCGRALEDNYRISEERVPSIFRIVKYMKAAISWGKYIHFYTTQRQHASEDRNFYIYCCLNQKSYIKYSFVLFQSFLDYPLTFIVLINCKNDFNMMNCKP